MSFSSDVKKELLDKMPETRSSMMAELAGMLRVSFSSENEGLSQKFFTLCRKAFNIDVSVFGNPSPKKSHTEFDWSYADVVLGQPKTEQLRKEETSELLENRRAYLRGAFLAAGSVSTPEKYYHLEIVCRGEETAAYIRNAMGYFQLDAGTVERKKDSIVYLKEGEQIVRMLGEMGASISFLNLESIRVMRQMRGKVNRTVNCETANLNKTIVSAVRQMEAIHFLQERGMLQSLKPSLKEMAEVRLAYPETPLAQLGQYLDPPIGKSGVNHRLKKLSELAESIKNGMEEVPSGGKTE